MEHSGGTLSMDGRGRGHGSLIHLIDRASDDIDLIAHLVPLARGRCPWAPSPRLYYTIAIQLLPDTIDSKGSQYLYRYHGSSIDE